MVRIDDLLEKINKQQVRYNNLMAVLFMLNITHNYYEIKLYEVKARVQGL